MSLNSMPSKNTKMAIALMVCITLILKFVGLLGSFFLKKYINKFKKKLNLQLSNTWYDYFIANN